MDSMPMHLITQAQFTPKEYALYTAIHAHKISVHLQYTVYQSISHLQTVHTGALGLDGLPGEAGVPGCCMPGAKGDEGPLGIRGLDGPTGKKIQYL